MDRWCRSNLIAFDRLAEIRFEILIQVPIIDMSSH